MTNKQKIIVSEEQAGERLDLVLTHYLEGEFSRSQIKRWIQEGGVLVNTKPAKANTLLKLGDEVEFEPKAQEREYLSADEGIPLDIVYDDEDLLVVNKQPGLVVHPGSGNPSRTLANALIHYTNNKLSGGSAPLRPGIVHRIDKNTSGLLVVAKNDWTHERLAKQFKEHTIDRRYWVVVAGVVQHDELKCDQALGKSPLDKRKVIVEPVTGKASTSFFCVKERFRNATLLEAKLETGRTHQIRVHLKHLGYPVLGDREYGQFSKIISRQALHAKTLKFLHPRTEKIIAFDSELPEDFNRLLNYLRENSVD